MACSGSAGSDLGLWSSTASAKLLLRDPDFFLCAEFSGVQSFQLKTIASKWQRKMELVRYDPKQRSNSESFSFLSATWDHSHISPAAEALWRKTHRFSCLLPCPASASPELLGTLESPHFMHPHDARGGKRLPLKSMDLILRHSSHYFYILQKTTKCWQWVYDLWMRTYFQGSQKGSYQ